MKGGAATGLGKAAPADSATLKGAPLKADGSIDTEALKRMCFIDALKTQQWIGSDFAWGDAMPDDPALKETPHFNKDIPIPDVAVQPEKFVLDLPKSAVTPPTEEEKRQEQAQQKGNLQPAPMPKGVHQHPHVEAPPIDPNVDWAPVAVQEGPVKFTTKSFSYRSEGLKIGGFAAIPEGTDRKPTVILIHGYVPTERYTSDNLRREAEYLASRDFLVLVPDLRNYGSSDKVDANEEIRRLGYLHDTIILLSMVHTGQIPEGDPGEVCLWGFGHGGDIAVKAAIVGGAQGVMTISGTGLQMALDHDMFAKTMCPAAAAGMDALYGPPNAENDSWYRNMTASNFFSQLSCPIGMVNGELDPIVTIDRPRGILSIITPLGIQAQMNSLPRTGHNFYGHDWLSMMQVTAQFMQDRMRAGKPLPGTGTP